MEQKHWRTMKCDKSSEPAPTTCQCSVAMLHQDEFVAAQRRWQGSAPGTQLFAWICLLVPGYLAKPSPLDPGVENQTLRDCTQYLYLSSHGGQGTSSVSLKCKDLQTWQPHTPSPIWVPLKNVSCVWAQDAPFDLNDSQECAVSISNFRPNQDWLFRPQHKGKLKSSKITNLEIWICHLKLKHLKSCHPSVTKLNRTNWCEESKSEIWTDATVTMCGNWVDSAQHFQAMWFIYSLSLSIQRILKSKDYSMLWDALSMRRGVCWHDRTGAVSQTSALRARLPVLWAVPKTPDLGVWQWAKAPNDTTNLEHESHQNILLSTSTDFYRLTIFSPMLPTAWYPEDEGHCLPELWQLGSSRISRIHPR